MALTKVQNTGIADDAVTTDKIENTTVVAADIAAGTVSADKLASTLDLSSKTVTLKNNEISNAELANSSITVNGSSVSLGGSTTLKHIDWQAVTVADGSTLLQAEAGKGYFLDTNAGVIEIRLPSSPSRGDTIVFADYASHFDLNHVIINTAGQNIDSTVTGDIKVTTKDAIVELVYVDANKGYLVKMNQTAGSTPSSVLTEGLYDKDADYIEATGGTITTVDDNYKVHTFTGDGCFVVSKVGNAAGSNSVEYMVVAGGAGNGTASGGGAGGWRASSGASTSGPFNAGPSSLVGCVPNIPVTTQTYPITVGAGGSSGSSGTSGSDSTFSTITSGGGGGGGSPGGGGGNGGSGGGGGNGQSGGGGNGNTPPVSPPQGNAGRNGTPGSDGGGGGGAGSGGGTQYAFGAGVASSITGSPVYYAAGGAGNGGGPNSHGRPVSTYGKSSTNRGYGDQSTSDPGNASRPDNGAGKGVVILRYRFQ